MLLPHDTCCSHLDDSQRTTTDVEHEKDFRAADEILADFWNEVVLDNFPVKCEYIENVCKDAVHVANHCRIS